MFSSSQLTSRESLLKERISKMRREKGKYFVSIVVGNPAKKSETQWKNRQEKVKAHVFASRTDAAIRTGATRKEKP